MKNQLQYHSNNRVISYETRWGTCVSLLVLAEACLYSPARRAGRAHPVLQDMAQPGPPLSASSSRITCPSRVHVVPFSWELETFSVN